MGLKNKSIVYCLYRRGTWGPYLGLFFFFDLDMFGYFYSDLDIKHLNIRLIFPCPHLKKTHNYLFSLLLQSLQRPEGEKWSQVFIKVIEEQMLLLPFKIGMIMLETPTISFILTLGFPRCFSGWRWSLYIFFIFLSRRIFAILHTPKNQMIISIESLILYFPTYLQLPFGFPAFALPVKQGG